MVNIHILTQLAMVGHVMVQPAMNTGHADVGLEHAQEKVDITVL
jgi:hypothetical protein